MALRGYRGDGLSIGWILHEFEDLSDPYTRDAVVHHVASADPSSWFSTQDHHGRAVRTGRRAR